MQTSNKTQAQCLPLPLIKADALSPGDGKAVFDKDTQLTWLNFGINRGQSFNDVINSLNTTYQGWRLPTEQEVRNLWGRLFAANVCSDDPYQVFRTWGANKTPLEHAPYSSYGYFLDKDNFLASASFVEEGTTRNPGRDPYYSDGVVKNYIVTAKQFQYDGSDTPPFNMSGTQEISTLLVK